MRHGHSVAEPGTPMKWHVFKLLEPYLLAYKSRVLLALSFLILAKLSSIALPFLLKHIVDDLSPASDTSKALLVAPLALVIAYGLVRFSNVLFGELRDTVFGRVTEGAMRQIGKQVFAHLHALDLHFHLNRKTGGLARDIERGTSGINSLMRLMVFNIVPTLLEVALVAVLLLLNYGWSFALVILISVVAYVAYSILATEWRTRFIREVNAADSTFNTRAVDSLLNYETVKYFTNEPYETERYDKDLATWEEAKRKNRLTLFALNGGQALIIALATTVMLALAALQVAEGTMTIGDFVLVNAFMMQIFIPLNFLGFVYREIKGSMANIEQMFELLHQRPEVEEAPDAEALPSSQGEIEFDHLRFHYSPERPILKDVSFTIPNGHKVALVGTSGSGKSTLVKLLFRFYDIQGGSIRIHGKDIRSLTLHSLRQAIGIVPQDTVLFNDSIYENVRYGKVTASEEEVLRAIRLAHLDDFVSQLPDGVHTQVGERGLKVSGGEKQRIAIARTILKAPPILVFDEATSSLDSQSERAIINAINEVSKGHTSLVIAHRLSTIVDADNIIVMHQGEKVEQGNHRQLLALGGHYASLWHTQQKQQEEAHSPESEE